MKILPYIVTTLVWLMLGVCCNSRREAGTEKYAQLAKFEQQFANLAYTDPVRAESLVDSMLHATADSNLYHCILSFKALSALSRNDSRAMDSIIRTVGLFIGSHPETAEQATPIRRKAICNICYAKGLHYSVTKQSDSAIFYFKKAAVLAEPHHRPQTYMNIADNYIQQGRYVEGAEAYRKALVLNDSAGDVIKSHLIYNGLGMTYMQIADYDEAERYFRLSLGQFDRMDNLDRYVLMNNFGNLYYFRKEYARALHYFLRADSCARSMPNRNIDSYVPLFNCTEIYVLLHRPEEAHACIDTLARVLADKRVPVFEAHLHTLRLALAIEEGKLQQAAGIIQAMEGEQLPLGLQSIRNRYLSHYYASTGNFRQAYLLERSIKQTDDSLRNIAVQTRVADIYLRYQQDTTLLAKQNHIRRQEFQLRRTHTVAILSGLIAVMLGGLAILIYLLMRRQRERIISRHIANISKMRMENIRNCLSPHFTFNVLNHEIAMFDSNDPRRDHMLNLVKILRRSVELSSTMTVPLSQEIDFVSTYVSLECSGWDDRFTFRMDVDPQIKAEDETVPTMFIQIPVENAIKHGLRGLDGKRSLTVSIRKQGQGIAISISNDGRGYRPQLMSSDTGIGMKVIYQTIALLNARNAEKITFDIHQLDPTHTGREGTVVSIFIPAGFDYSGH